MTIAEFQQWWTVGWVAGAAVVVIVAALLIAILLVARNILKLAGAALEIAGRIEKGTSPIWSLGEVNRLAERMVVTVRRIEASATRIADALDPAGRTP